MTNTLCEIIHSREDLSDFVFHFTKGANAKEVLRLIIEEKSIKDKRGRGYVCFSESPITMLSSMFNYFKQWDSPMYAPYGIGIKKEYLYQLGGRPVIYGDSDDLNNLADPLKWRFVQYIPGKYDFTWLREWRLPLSSINLSYDNCFFIVEQKNDCKDMLDLFMELNDIDIDAEPEDGGVYTTYTGYFTRKFKVISLEEITELSNMNKDQFSKLLQEQKREEGIYLGSTWE